MKRNLPVNFLEIIERWLSMCYSVVRWNCVFFICVGREIWCQTGLSVLSPFLFALYLDDILNNGKLISSN